MGEGHNGGPRNKCSNGGGQEAELEGQATFPKCRASLENRLQDTNVWRSLATLEKNLGDWSSSRGNRRRGSEESHCRHLSAKHSALHMGQLLKVWVGPRVLCKVGASAHVLTRQKRKVCLMEPVNGPLVCFNKY